MVYEISPSIQEDAAIPIEEKQTTNQVVSMFQASKQEKDKVSGNWEKFHRYYYGEQDDKPEPKWKSDVVINVCHSVVESILPIMTDDKPRLVIMPKEQNDSDTADAIGALVDKVWVDNKMSIELTKPVKNSLKYGTGFLKVFWDVNMNDGVGDIGIMNVDPRNIFPDPAATSMDDAQWIIFAVYRHYDYVHATYGERAKLIKPGKWGIERDLQMKKEPQMLRQEFMTPVTTTDGKSQYYLEKGGQYGGADKFANQVLIMECWWKPSVKYPDGRVVVIGNGVLLADKPNPFKHKKLPFIAFHDYVRPGVFWSMGELEQLIKPQNMLNKLLRQLVNIANYCGSPSLVIEGHSGLDRTSISNRPGNVYFVKAGSKVYWLEGANPPPMILQLLQQMQMYIDTISGIQDVTQGRKPSGIAAGRAILALQEAAQTRLRLKIRNMESSLEELGSQIVSLIQQFYTEPRIIRTVGDSGNPQWIQINQVTAEGIVRDVTKGGYDIEIVAGSTMPKHKSAKFEQGLMLFDRAIIDNEEVLKNADWQGWKEVIARTEQKKLQQMEDEMAAQNMELGAKGNASGQMLPEEQQEAMAQSQTGEEVPVHLTENEQGTGKKPREDNRER